jgi:hypothetical protein
MLNWKPTTTLRIGMLSLMTAILLGRLMHPSTTSGKDLLDGVTGVFFGIALGILIVTTYIERKRHA